MTALETLGAFIADGVRGQVTAATRARVALHVTDTVGAWVAGAHTPEGKRLLATAGHDNHLSGALTIHCALARLSEVDNIHLASSVTPGGIVIPAALTIAAARKDPGGDALLEAIVVGIETMVRLGLAIDGPTVLYRGIWPTYFTAASGVAAVAARLYDLDATQAAHALALALTFAAPGVGHHNATSTSRWFAIGHAASNGLIAAEAAQAGFTSDLSLLDGDFLGRIYDIRPDVSAIVASLGQHFAIDSTSIKPWCAARQTIAATQGLLEILDGRTRREEITAVEIGVPLPYLRMIDHGVTPGNRASYLTSVQFRLALAACDRSRLYDVAYSPDQLPADMSTFMQRISVRADETLLSHYPRAWPAKVMVRTAGGATERLMTAVPGDPQLPFDEGHIQNKFRQVLSYAVVDNIDALLAHSRSIVDRDQMLSVLISQITRAQAFK